MKDVVVRLEDLRKSYFLAGNREVSVLKGLNVEVKRGEFVGIMGASGSGKSTLLNILGLLDLPTSGSYYLNGIRTETMSDDQLAITRNAEIGFIFQSFNLFSHLTIEQNVEIPMIYSEIPMLERRKIAVELIKKVGLGHRLGHRPNQLSGGEKQRVAIARALSNKPAFLLADEPTGNLDEKTSVEIMKMFHELHASGVTIVMVTHNPEYVDEFDRVIRMRDGLVVDNIVYMEKEAELNANK
ncbi:MAG: ABC transporter ATP-binding protein [Lentisphaeria bacterium]